MIPGALDEALRAAAESLGFRRYDSAPLGASAYRLRAGDFRAFVKTAPAAEAGRLATEAEGLAALAPALRVPAVHARGEAAGRAWLALEWLELRPPGEVSAERLGRQLAAAHRLTAGAFGWRNDNWIGASPQDNGWLPDWTEFFAKRRLAPQLAAAADRGAGRLVRDGERLLAALPRILADHTPLPSLVHGDLWGGNWGMLPGGEPVVFDPAVHYADRECDLAMTELFGGFPAAFHVAYRESWPLDAGYELRRDLYQLYHLLNHFRLFGGGYRRQAEAAMARLLARTA